MQPELATTHGCVSRVSWAFAKVVVFESGSLVTTPDDKRYATPAIPHDAGLLAAAFSASPVPTLVVRIDGAEATIAVANPAFCVLAGWTAEDLRGRPYPLGDEASLEGADALRAALAGRRAVQVAVLDRTADVAVDVRIAPLDASVGHGDHLCVTHLPLGSAGGEHASVLQAALDQKTALLHELDHRVKNNLQVITSLVLLKARRTVDGPARAALNSMADRIGALSTAHRLLYPVGDVSRFDLKDFVVDFAADLASTVDPARITVTAEAGSVPVAASKAAPLALLVHELATNAVRHAFPDERTGRVLIAVRREEAAVHLMVEDDGVGREVQEGAPGFGRALVEMVVRQMRGTLTYEPSEPGTRVTVTVPLNADEVEVA